MAGPGGRHMWGFERVAGPFALTEGPVWTGTDLLFTDIHTSRILTYDPATNTSGVFAEDTNEANGMARDRRGYLYVCEGGFVTGRGRRVVRYTLGGQRVVLAAEFE